jgi:aspartokinase-like uncharacterized kinase
MIDERPIAVVKVGGSLLEWPALPAALRRSLDARIGQRLVLVPGGGEAADLVRRLDRLHALGDAAAHALALRALDLTAHALAAIVPGLEVLDDCSDLGPSWRGGRIPVLAPRQFLAEDDRRSDALPHGWIVTSDSIAARLAVRLEASELVLLKSASAPAAIDRAGAARLGLVDAAFPLAARDLERVTLVNLRDGTAARLEA